MMSVSPPKEHIHSTQVSSQDNASLHVLLEHYKLCVSPRPASYCRGIPDLPLVKN